MEKPESGRGFSELTKPQRVSALNKLRLNEVNARRGDGFLA